MDGEDGVVGGVMGGVMGDVRMQRSVNIALVTTTSELMYNLEIRAAIPADWLDVARFATPTQYERSTV